MSILGNNAILNVGKNQKLFVKAYQKDASIEYEKAQQVYASSQKTDIFLAPKPLHLVEEFSIIIWEYLSDLKNLREYMLSTHNSKNDKNKLHENIFLSCGQALGTIHTTLNFIGNDEITQPIIKIDKTNEKLYRHAKSVLKNSPAHPIHGDFACVNIFLKAPQQNNSRIVIIDASPNLWLFEETPTYARSSIYWDLSLFVASLYSNPIFFFQFKNSLNKLIEQFIFGYEEVSSFRIDRTTLFACSAAVLSTYREYSMTLSSRKSWKDWRLNHFRGRMIKYLYKHAKKTLP